MCFCSVASRSSLIDNLRCELDVYYIKLGHWLSAYTQLRSKASILSFEIFVFFVFFRVKMSVFFSPKVNICKSCDKFEIYLFTLLIHAKQSILRQLVSVFGRNVQLFKKTGHVKGKCEGFTFPDPKFGMFFVRQILYLPPNIQNQTSKNQSNR